MENDSHALDLSVLKSGKEGDVYHSLGRVKLTPLVHHDCSSLDNILQILFVSTVYVDRTHTGKVPFCARHYAGHCGQGRD